MHLPRHSFCLIVMTHRNTVNADQAQRLRSAMDEHFKVEIGNCGSIEHSP